MRFKSTIQTYTSHRLRARLLACALAVVIGISGPLYAIPQHAYAEVLRSDVIVGETVDQRALTVANCPSIDAAYAILMDSDGTVYFERDCDTETHIASITKVMTAIVALENGQLTDKITVSEKAAQIGESSANLQAGDVMTLSTALKALMIPSGNDAAEALCEYYGAQMLTAQGQTPTTDEAIAAFVQAMNDKAAELGMTNTVFSNPHGLDDGEYAGALHSTARDVAKMCAYAMQKQDFRNCVNQESATITVERDGAQADIELESTDELLGVLEGACGVKTGFTDTAGACFAGAVNRDGKEIYTVVLGCQDELQRFTDTETLVEWYFEHNISFKLANSPQSVKSEITGTNVPLIANIAHQGYVNKTIPAVFADSNQAIEVFDLMGNVSQVLVPYEINGDVKAGDVIGQVSFLQHNEEIARVDIVAAQDVAAPGFFESIGIAFDRFLRGFTGDSTVASSELINTSTLIKDKTSTI